MNIPYNHHHFISTLLFFLMPVRLNAKLIYFILLLPITYIQGQVFHIYGNISTDSVPVSYASITFIDEDNPSNTFTTLTDTGGNYQLDIINGIIEDPVIPKTIELAQNYPNPFSIETEILYKLNNQTNVSLKIFNILGEEVKTFNTELTSSGIYRLKWDGKNNLGFHVTPGVYLYQLRAENETLAKKMVYTGGTTIKYVPFPSNISFTERIEKTKSTVITKSYTCIIENNNNTNPRILTKEIKEIKIVNDSSLNIIAIRESDAYFPLSIGNEWTFHLTYFDPWIGHDTTQIYDYRIITTKNVNGETYYGFNRAMPFFPVNSFIENFDSVFVRQNEKGDIMLLLGDSEYLYFAFDPSLLGFLIRTKIKDTDYSYRIESINDTAITPISSFNKCFKILNYFPEIKDTEHYIWFAAGYGPIKIYYPELGDTYQLVKVNIQK